MCVGERERERRREREGIRVSEERDEGGKERQREREQWKLAADFEDRGSLWTKECRQPLETGKDKETHFPSELPEGMQFCQ